MIKRKIKKHILQPDNLNYYKNLSLVLKQLHNTASETDKSILKALRDILLEPIAKNLKCLQSLSKAVKKQTHKSRISAQIKIYRSILKWK